MPNAESRNDPDLRVVPDGTLHWNCALYSRDFIPGYYIGVPNGTTILSSLFEVNSKCKMKIAKCKMTISHRP